MNRSLVAALASSAGADLLARYNMYFRTQAAGTPESIEMALAIRYQVFCLERSFENPAQHSDHLEKDEFDRRRSTVSFSTVQGRRPLERSG